jgi:hypothetical protein
MQRILIVLAPLLDMTACCVHAGKNDTTDMADSQNSFAHLGHLSIACVPKDLSDPTVPSHSKNPRALVSADKQYSRQ